MWQKELILYRNLRNEELFRNLTDLMGACESWGEEGPGEQQREELAGILYESIRELIELAERCGFSGNLWHCYLADLLVNDENAYSLSCEMKGNPGGSIREAALHDIQIFHGMFRYDFGRLMETLKVPALELVLDYHRDDRGIRMYNRRISARICELAGEMEGSGSPEKMQEILGEFYRAFGVGKFGLHKSFRVTHDEEGVHIEPIRNIAHVRFDDLVGYDMAKQKLRDNTDAFVGGRPANNCLLFGDAGTGKSSCIKAMTNEYYDKGLRVIEIYKHQFQDLQAVISQIKNRGYRFVIYMDDLSFEDFEIEYKYLKAVIEGGLEKRPDNVLIYATSNRRHLIREGYADKEDEDMHTGDTVQEKLSLAYRFGVTIYFGKPDKKQFQEIVSVLADRYGIEMPKEELLLKANQWELSHGGLSGRCASQFVDYLRGNVE